MVKVNFAPPAADWETIILPPWDSTIVRQIDSPTPIPQGLVVTIG